MSVYSRGSNNSRGSKRVAKASEVDDNLFGKKPSTAVVRNREETEKVLQEVRNGELKNPNAIIIPSSELQRMKKIAVITTKEEQLHQQKILNEQNEKQMAAAKAKKQKMLEMEAERKKNVPPSQNEEEDQIYKDNLQSRANQIMNEQRDEVKHMNQLILHAKTVTIRDKQLDEKKEVIEQKKLEEKRKDLMMEVERLKKVKYYEEIERQKKIEEREKSSEVIQQIKERELERLKAQEEKEREGQRIVQGIKQLQHDEAQANLKKKANQRQLNEEIYHTNQRAIVSKQKIYDQERLEEEKIVRYNQEKALKDAEYYAEIKRVKDEKEREVQRLREMQEKAYDRQSEIDELRAKRAVELHERQAREKERVEAEYKARMNQDLFEARKVQSLEKEVMLQEQAKHERDEFQKVIHQQKLERDLELKTDQERKQMVFDHAQQVKKQMALNEEKFKQTKKTKLEEGKKVKDKLAHEKRTLEHIKKEKMEELQNAGVPKKYMGDLAKKKIIV